MLQTDTSDTSKAEVKSTKTSDAELKSKWDEIAKEVAKLEATERTAIITRRVLATNITEILEANSTLFVDRILSASQYRDLKKKVRHHLDDGIETMEQFATKYFMDHFKNSKKQIIGELEFFHKLEGSQLGLKMQIKYVDSNTQLEHEIIYFIKTHQHGTQRTARRSHIKPVDPKELFIYKVLEYMGFGPKVHFFFNPLVKGDFYIATQDCAFTKTLGKEKTFLPALLKLNKGIDDRFIGMAAIDLLSRIFCLNDITKAYGTNFGLVTINHKTSKWQIVDFRVDIRHSYYRKNYFVLFVSGKDTDDKQAIDEFKDRIPVERMIALRTIIAEFESGKSHQSKPGFKSSLVESITKAFHEIAKFIKDNALPLGVYLKDLLGDLAKLDLEQMSDNEFFSYAKKPSIDVGEFGEYVIGVAKNFEELVTAFKASSETASNKPLPPVDSTTNTSQEVKDHSSAKTLKR